MNISQLPKDELVYNLLQKGLDASQARSEATADNMANINTKGYKRKYVTFEESLKKSVDDLELKTDDEKHIKVNSEYGSVNIKTDDSTSMNEDGNNVDIDNEMVNQSANALMYNALVTQVNNKLSMRRYVIDGK
ncbi:flagellar basal body rod protein FlgB [Clostridium luticellarii]|uniref:flagellar basal body rod protein FlgB n=1 Tax=Clostridium luticellarii TaxID=1691940 RepID=UPI002355A3A2|nr:flagellar basal body rod protein FlgB [Clostridium luticellarii]MCI1943668.1 flagellar basal body rod protein FlgB [Clostridium luticellarii]MCI1968919.1 flagellar basal body rod protein FlgB [Clostridium luticellarii]MCI1994296.1 flagellar basal body rod protein FlgB [Clostridium luticellarii]MCI2038751.1 flagellar basal body rod protein FlgB [Clostridium luticellarii]